MGADSADGGAKPDLTDEKVTMTAAEAARAGLVGAATFGIWFPIMASIDNPNNGSAQADADALSVAPGADTAGTPPGGPDDDGNGEQKVYRGGDKLEVRSIDVRIDKATGLVKPGRGVSLSSDAEALTQRFGSAKEIVSVPNELQIVRTSGSHFEIAPRAPMTMERYQQLLNQVVMK